MPEAKPLRVPEQDVNLSVLDSQDVLLIASSLKEKLPSSRPPCAIRE